MVVLRRNNMTVKQVFFLPKFNFFSLSRLQIQFQLTCHFNNVTSDLELLKLTCESLRKIVQQTKQKRNKDKNQVQIKNTKEFLTHNERSKLVKNKKEKKIAREQFKQKRNPLCACMCQIICQ